MRRFKALWGHFKAPWVPWAHPGAETRWMGFYLPWRGIWLRLLYPATSWQALPPPTTGAPARLARPAAPFVAAQRPPLRAQRAWPPSAAHNSGRPKAVRFVLAEHARRRQAANRRRPASGRPAIVSVDSVSPSVCVLSVSGHTWTDTDTMGLKMEMRARKNGDAGALEWRCGRVIMGIDS